MSPTRVLLTGASGFIGVRAIGPLLEAGCEVHLLGRSCPLLGGSGAERVHWHEVDLLDPGATSRAVAEIEAERLLHLAWFTEHGLFWSAGANLDWVGASLHLLRAFAEAGGRRAAIAGTCAEYDWSDPGPACLERPRDGRDATPLRPATLYGASKHATRLVAEAYAREVGVSLAWGRVFFLYGPGEDERRLVPQVARALLGGEEAATSDGAQVRDFMHVDDVAAAFAALLASRAEGPVNVASGIGVPIAEVLETIARATGRPDLLRRGALPRREGEPERLVADVGRLREEVGFRPSIPLAPGIEQTVEALRALEGR
jgi:nucleoside-diphosphate-sugar epimerase